MTTAPAAGPEPHRATVESAAQWTTRLHAEHATDEDRAACARWRAEHPSHEVAWQRMQALWNGFDPAATGLPSAAARAAIDAGTAASVHARRRLRHTTTAAGVFAMVAALSVTLARWLPVDYWLADARSGVGEHRVVDLPDASSMTLDSRSAADIRYDASHRRIVLHQGGVLVDVARDAGRPFLVETPQGTAQALGTRYVVRRDRDSTVVSVIESHVQVCPRHTTSGSESLPAPAHTSPTAGCQRVAPGQQIRIDAQGVGTLEKVDTQALIAWTEGQLVVDNQPLTQVLATLEQHRSGRIRFDPQDLQGIRVSGVFPLNDTDRTLDVLGKTLPVRVQRYSPWWVVVQRRQ